MPEEEGLVSDSSIRERVKTMSLRKRAQKLRAASREKKERES